MKESALSGKGKISMTLMTRTRTVIGFVSVIIFFSLLTQRILISTENKALEILAFQPWMRGFRVGNNTHSNNTLALEHKRGNQNAGNNIDYKTATPPTHTTILEKLSNFEKSIEKSMHMYNGTAKVKYDDKNIDKNTDNTNIGKNNKENTDHISNKDTDNTTKSKKNNKKEKDKNNKKDNKNNRNRNDHVSLNMLKATEAADYHPHISPRLGTDISDKNQLSILRCPNQSKCIVPELQLSIKLKIYFCKHPTNHGVRFYYLMKEGLLLHPNVVLVEEKDMYTADYVMYLPGNNKDTKMLFFSSLFFSSDFVF